MEEPRVPDSYDDINEVVVAEWREETTPAERVTQVISTTYTPVQAATVAEQAVVSPKTARKHLEWLADEGIVARRQGDHGATLYHRSAESLVTERTRRLRAEYSVEELAARIADLEADLEAFRTEHDVDSPEDLAVRHGTDTLDGGGDADSPLDESVVTRWQTTRRNLAFVTAALSIARASEFVLDERTDTASATPSQ